MQADRDQLIARLSEVNYYRLSGYWYPFRDLPSDKFKPDTKFDIVWDRYVFDRQLRVLVMDAIERIEISIGTRLTNEFTKKYGPFGYRDRSNFSGMSYHQHQVFLTKIREETERSHEKFVDHFKRKYTSETDLPLWMAIELMSFGGILTFYKNVEQYIKREVANAYGLSAAVLESWLLTLNFVRNICAHHNRLWNRALVLRPIIPNKRNRPEFHDPIEVNNGRTFAVLTILRYLLANIAPQSNWQKRLEHLLEVKHRDIPIDQMGFPENWKDCLIWKDR